LLALAAPLSAQDFGFDGGFDGPPAEGFDGGGFSAEEFSAGFGDFSGEGSSGVAFDLSGDVKINLMSYFNDYKEGWNEEDNFLSRIWRPGSISAGLNLAVSGKLGEAVLGFSFDPAGFVSQDESTDSASLFNISNVLKLGEVYVRTFIGDFELEAGRRRINWGKADFLGPLNVINTMDISGLSSGGGLESMMSGTTPATLLHGAYHFGNSKIEAVFVPVYEPMDLGGLSSGALGALAGGGSTSGMASMLTPIISNTASGLTTMGSGLLTSNPAQGHLLLAQAAQLKLYAGEALTAKLSSAPDTTYLKYFQAGARFTTIIGPVDLGAQYYYGYKPFPATNYGALTSALTSAAASLAAATSTADIDAALADLPSIMVYNPYHQIGVDAAFSVYKFNIRAEAAANLTYDIEGDDPAVYNPNIAWNIGFDREIFWDITLMAMVNQTITLGYDNIDRSTGYLDTEASSKHPTSTMAVLALMRDFLDGDLSVTIAALATLEDFGIAVIPSVSWKHGGFTASLSAGYLWGTEDSLFGTKTASGGTLAEEMNFVNLSLGYSF
jgi:hypothetical protein